LRFLCFYRCRTVEDLRSFQECVDHLANYFVEKHVRQLRVKPGLELERNLATDNNLRLSNNWRINKPFVRPPDMKIRCEIAEHHLGQSENCIFCFSMTSHTCRVWCNVLTHICQSIGHHYKGSVDKLILRLWLFADTKKVCSLIPP